MCCRYGTVVFLIQALCKLRIEDWNEDFGSGAGVGCAHAVLSGRFLSNLQGCWRSLDSSIRLGCGTRELPFGNNDKTASYLVRPKRMF